MRVIPEEEYREIIWVLSGHLKRYYGQIPVEDTGLTHHEFMNKHGHTFVKDLDKLDVMVRMYNNFVYGSRNYALLLYETELLYRLPSIVRFSQGITNGMEVL